MLPGSPSEAKPLYCVVSHTHWDREWYLPLEQFRIRLVDLIDNLLVIMHQHPTYVFHLDAQTVVLDDYLEIRPEQREPVCRLVAEGRLLTGPWYVQGDFHLVSGEAIVRNLMIGTRMAESFGHCGRAGYVPDQFGLCSQLPQILRGFGLDNAVFGRGFHFHERTPEGEMRSTQNENEFWWESEDGSRVLGIFMRHWYNNAQRFSADPDRSLRHLELIVDTLRKTSTTPYLLLMNGVDHLEAQEDLLPILQQLNDRLTGAEIRQVDLDDYVEKVKTWVHGKPLGHFTGEMRHGGEGSTLPGTLSSRVYIKIDNVRAQALLENCLEPLYAMTGMAGAAGTWPAGYLHYLWKLLVVNHAHDSICGCSCDTVYLNMADRYLRIQACGQDLVKRGMRWLAERLDRNTLKRECYVLVAANTLTSARTETLTASLSFPEEENISDFRILDSDGADVPYEIVARGKKMLTVLSPVNLPGLIRADEVTVRFVAHVKGMAWRTWTILPHENAPAPDRVTDLQKENPHGRITPHVADCPLVMDNGMLRVEIAGNGTVNLLDLIQGTATTDILALEDESDLGHSYIHGRAPERKVSIVSASQPDIAVVEWTALQKSVKLTWAVPPLNDPVFAKVQRGVDAGPNCVVEGLRTNEKAVEGSDGSIALLLTLRAESQVLEIQADIDNRARDHRLRLIIRTDIATDISHSSAPFDVVQRDRRDILKGVRSNATEPNSGMVTVSDGRQSLTVFNEGLFEYEHLMDDRHSVALTLLRATGLISGSFAEDIPPPDRSMAPGNQCVRLIRERMAIMPGDGDLSEGERHYREFLVPMITHFDSADERKFTGGRTFVQDSELQELFFRDIPRDEQVQPLARQLVRVEGRCVVVSAFKRSEADDMWLLRLYNPAAATERVTLHFGAPVTSAWLLRLDESVLAPLTLNGNAVEIECGRKQVITIGVR